MGENQMTEEELLADFFRTSSNCWGLKFFPCYVLKGDSPVELIEEEDCWMVVRVRAAPALL